MLKQSISRKSSNRTKAITRNATCCELFDSNEVDYCYNICSCKVDVLTHAREKGNKVIKANISVKYVYSLGQIRMPLTLLGHCTI